MDKKLDRFGPVRSPQRLIAEYSKSPEYITFSSGADGMISIELRNITHIENR